MSVEAITWANKQRAGSPGAKLVLLALANYADEDGYCYPSQATLATVTEMSRDSIARHMKALEALGLLAREGRFDKTGRRTTDMVRLLVSPQGTPQFAGVGTPAGEGGAPPQKQGVRTPHGAGDLNLKKEPSDEPSPQAPQGAGAGISNSDGEGEQGTAPALPDTQADALWEMFDPDPAASKAKFLRAWARLAPVDRAQALALASRFLDHCRAVKRRICDPSTYLSERRWERFASLPASAPAAEAVAARPVEADPVSRAVQWAMSGKTDERWVFVPAGSADWQAWQEAFAATGNAHRLTYGRFLTRLPDGSMARLPGRSFPMRRPPMPGADPPGEAAANSDDMAEFANSGG
ncbi:helix-turn-helix domain-containing protein [Ancylobacter sp. IITR112]|uniref:helix-turn-helix domain-containing protein n=1 Tax=Ancylobacter sp. IITR112 TaxID=3138073 RepID=UPI00352AE27E